MKNKILIILIFVTIIIFSINLISDVSALGISPGRTTIQYEPGQEKTGKISILNSEYKSMDIELEVKGELKDSVVVSEEVLEFSSLDYSKEVSYKITLPENIKDKPGLHTAEIIAMENPGSKKQGTHVGATVAVVSQIYVFVSCPGKCIESDLQVQSDGTGKSKFIVGIISRGQQKIEQAKAEIEIFSLSGEKINSIETNTDSIEPSARKELVGFWNTKEGGDYIAKVKISYDEKIEEFEKQFSIGEQTLLISDIFVNDFRLGGIAKFIILIENKWNQELKDVYANLIVYNQQNQELGNIKSASENIAPNSEKELVAYWDTVGIEEGEYNGKLMIKYNQKSADKNLVLKISESSLEVLGVGYAISPEGGGGFSLTTILIIVVVLLLLVNLSWFLLFRKLKKRKNNK